MVKFIIFGGDIPWSELKNKIIARLKTAKEQGKFSEEEIAQGFVEDAEEFLNNQEIWMKKQDN